MSYMSSLLDVITIGCLGLVALYATAKAMVCFRVSKLTEREGKPSAASIERSEGVMAATLAAALVAIAVSIAFRMAGGMV